MAFLQIGPRRPLPDPIPNPLLEPLLAIDPWMHYGDASRACSVTMSDGVVKPRVSVTVVDEFDDAWAAGYVNLAPVVALPPSDIVDIQPSPHALPAELASKAMQGEEWRPSTYQYAVVLQTGEVFTLLDSVAVWLPDSLTTTDIADVVPNPSDEHEWGGPIPRPEFCYVSTPQTHDADRETYERHFREEASPGIAADLGAALREARHYAERFPLRDRPLAYAAKWDQLTTGVSRYERFTGDDIDLLARFARREGHCNVPENHVEAGRRLSAVGLATAVAMGDLPAGDLRRLNALPGWDAAMRIAADRVIGFDQLRPERSDKHD